MPILRTVLIRDNERGLLYLNGDFRRLLEPGRHWIWGAAWKMHIQRVSMRDVYFQHPYSEVIARSGALAGTAEIIDLKDHQRALVWVDGRFYKVLGPGLHVLWRAFHETRHEIVDARELRLDHRDLPVILASEGSARLIERVVIDPGHTGLLLRDGRHVDTLPAGTYALWKDVGRLRVIEVDLREQVLDINGQDIMTADKVSLRLNAVLTYQVTDAARLVTAVEDYRQALYREAQLALRKVIGTRELDALLADKDEVARELADLVRERAATLGLGLLALGIRDLILPGEMRSLMNQVTEARKAAEANLIVRREETAAMRSQANTAKILESNPTLMKLKELEVLEKVAEKADLNVVLTETGLSERVLKLV